MPIELPLRQLQNALKHQFDVYEDDHLGQLPCASAPTISGAMNVTSFLKKQLSGALKTTSTFSFMSRKKQQ